MASMLISTKKGIISSLKRSGVGCKQNASVISTSSSSYNNFLQSHLLLLSSRHQPRQKSTYNNHHHHHHVLLSRHQDQRQMFSTRTYPLQEFHHLTKDASKELAHAERVSLERSISKVRK